MFANTINVFYILFFGENKRFHILSYPVNMITIFLNEDTITKTIPKLR